MTTADVHRFFERQRVSRTASKSSSSRAPEEGDRYRPIDRKKLLLIV
jgi:hypothetical protein